jgi:hypothetical protein
MSQAKTSRERWLKVQAMNVVAQLPEDSDEALRVLSYAQQLVVEFLAEKREFKPLIVHANVTTIGPPRHRSTPIPTNRI